MPLLLRFPLALLVLLAVAPAAAQPDTTAASPGVATGPRLVAAVHDAPPFAVKQEDGSWDGIAVELWREIGRREGFEPALREVPEDQLIDAVATGAADVALTAAATADAEGRVDFTLPYYSAALGVAQQRGSGVFSVIGRLLSPTFFKILGGLAVLLLLVGLLEWAFERRHESSDFDEGASGAWDGFYWAGVTMTTIGYGDKVPKTTGGRIVALLWMIVAMAVTAAFTAALVSALGLKGGMGSASLPADVRGQTVGVVEGSVAAAFLEAERVDVRPFPSIDAGLEAVRADSLDAFVAAAPVLEHALTGVGDGLTVSKTWARPQQWAFAVAPGSPLRERLSRAVLEESDGPAWQATLERYLNRGSGG